jgi:hypothetical protein
MRFISRFYYQIFISVNQSNPLDTVHRDVSSCQYLNRQGHSGLSDADEGLSYSFSHSPTCFTQYIQDDGVCVVSDHKETDVRLVAATERIVDKCEAIFVLHKVYICPHPPSHVWQTHAFLPLGLTASENPQIKVQSTPGILGPESGYDISETNILAL